MNPNARQICFTILHINVHRMYLLFMIVEPTQDISKLNSIQFTSCIYLPKN